MKYFPAPLSDAESDALIDRICAHHVRYGFGLWAVELRATATLIGFTGLAVPQGDLPFAPCIEIGWRLAYEYWGQGYATEAARAALAFGFNEQRLEEIVSFTAPINKRSQRVMQRLGMQRSDKEDFYHPALSPTHLLAKHVLYRLSREIWEVQGLL
jgi:RimJ/RimL family protein N-acetyltransferase